MERRDLAWITTKDGTLVAVAVVRINPVSCRVDFEDDVVVHDGEALHVPGVVLSGVPS